MTTPDVELAPKTLGQIFDDAWRLYLAAVSLLLLLSGLSFVPAAILLLFLLTSPGVDGWPALALAAALTLLVPLSGISAGAVQEVFHRWAERQPVSAAACLRAALRRGFNHATVQVLCSVLPLGALLLFFAAGPAVAILALALHVPVALTTIAWHAVLTGGQKHVWRAYRYSQRSAARHFDKASVVVAWRVLVLAVGMLNVHLFLAFGLTVADSLAGLDVAALGLILTPANPTYLICLGAVLWWLLAPLNEAVNYLFYADARARYEGLDLWYRIEEKFTLRPGAKAGAALIACAASFLAAGVAGAQDRAAEVRAARQRVAAVRKEMQAAQPYPGGDHWREPLRDTGARLDPDGGAADGRYGWYFKEIDRLGRGGREDDLKIVARLESRLDAVEKSLARPPHHGGGAGGEHSPEEIRKLVPPLREPDQAAPPPKNEKTPQQKKRIENDVEGDGVNLPGPAPATGVVAPVALGGAIGQALLIFLIVLIVAIVVLVIGLGVRSLRGRRAKAAPRSTGRARVRDEYLENPDREDVQSLWRRADDLARAGKFLEALRALYLGVLALLHQAHLIRYERTRTNGEYADQLRRHAAVHETFQRLTRVFEVKWYGERACVEADYRSCRELAELLHAQSRADRAA